MTSGLKRHRWEKINDYRKWCKDCNLVARIFAGVRAAVAAP